MQRSKIAGIGFYVPENVFTNNDLKKYMDTSDEWIQERTGIKERRYANRPNSQRCHCGNPSAYFREPIGAKIPQLHAADCRLLPERRISPGFESRSTG